MATASINTVLLSGHVNHKAFAFSSCMASGLCSALGLSTTIDPGCDQNVASY